MEKKSVVLGIAFLLVVFGLSSVYASSCDSDDRIMRLSSETNAHGEVWDGTNYSLDICFSDFFGNSYEGDNPHECTGDNNILDLSSETNAHAEGPEEDNYDVEVCYGDLNCSLINNNEESCDSDEAKIVGLSDKTNAHLAINSYNYDYSICCSSEEGEDPVSVLENVRILGSQRYRKNIGQTVDPEVEAVYNDNTVLLEDQENFSCSSSNESVVSLVEGEKCKFEANELGEAEITASYEDGVEKTDSINLEVVEGDVPSNIEIEPQRDSIFIDENLEYSVYLNYTQSSREEISENLTFEVEDNSIANMTENVATGLSEGNTGINVIYDSGDEEFNGLVSLTVEGEAIEGAYWADMDGNPISEESIRSEIKLIVEGTNMNDKIDYKIYKEDGGLFGLWDSKELESSSRGFMKWKVGENDEGEIREEEERYYFIATHDDEEFDSRDNGNGILNATLPETNEEPEGEIINPNDEEKFAVGEEISFEQVSSDPDDDLKVKWIFGEEDNETLINCQTGSNCNTTHSYDTSGTKVVNLIIEEMERDQYYTDSIEIYVYDTGYNLFDVISDPEDESSFYGGNIDFRANESYVANCFSDSECNFPSGSGLSQDECYNVGEEENELSCYDLPKTEEWLGNDSSGYGYELWFNWSFSNGGNKIGSWSDNYTDVVEFDRFFRRVESNHWAELKLGIESLQNEE